MLVTVAAEVVQPHQSAAKNALEFLVLTGEEIDELRRASLDSAARDFVLRDNCVAKEEQGLVLMRGEKLRRVLPCRRGRLLLLDHFVGQFGGLCRNHLEDGAARRADRQIFQDVAPGNTARSFAALRRVAHVHRLPFFACSSRYSEARQASAMMVSVGFLSGLVTSGAPSVTKRFFTS